MTWIKYILPEDATGRLEQLYKKYQRANRTVANIITAHSVRPHILEGHMAFYRSVLGHSANTLPVWFLEAVGVYVSAFNKCAYCVDHHRHFGGQAFDGTQAEWNAIADAMIAGEPDTVLDARQAALVHYAGKVTKDPASVSQTDIDALRDLGADDGEIFEVNQVAGYFAYANRTVLGLGVTLDGEVHVT